MKGLCISLSLPAPSNVLLFFGKKLIFSNDSFSFIYDPEDMKALCISLSPCVCVPVSPSKYSFFFGGSEHRQQYIRKNINYCQKRE